MPKNLSKIAKAKKIKYFLISFVDLFGVLRSKLVPAQAIGDMQKDGAGFAGFATWLDMTPADSDMFGVPDPDRNAKVIANELRRSKCWNADITFNYGVPIWNAKQQLQERHGVAMVAAISHSGCLL